MQVRPSGVTRYLERRFSAISGRTVSWRAVACLDGSRVASIDLRFGRVGRMQTCLRPFGAADERLLALMGSANKVPYWNAGFDALATGWVVLIPGLTGSPSPRIALATSSARFIAQRAIVRPQALGHVPRGIRLHAS
jgi:hypothetical protein